MHLLSAIRDSQLRRGNVRQVIVFGSMATGHARPDSDLDIALDLGHRMLPDEKITLIKGIWPSSQVTLWISWICTWPVNPLLGQVLAHGKRLIGSQAGQATLIPTASVRYGRFSALRGSWVDA